MDKTGNASSLQTTLDLNINIVSTDQPTQELKPNTANTRKSSKTRKEMKRYGDLTNLDFLDSSDDVEPPHKRRAASVASNSPPKASIFGTPASPARSSIPVISISHSNINTGLPPQSQNETHIAPSGNYDAAKTTKTTSDTSSSPRSNPQHVYVKTQKHFLCLMQKLIKIKNCRSYIMLNCLT